MIQSISLADLLKRYRLNASEYDRMCSLLGREPKPIEWALFSALWSEHCSYKSSKIHLKKFAQTLNEKTLGGDEENAGVLDLGEGERLAFKMESHNHPSFIEPYQGAATGVGGILRDIFTMGARPIALADYLCFGSPQEASMKKLVDSVIRGISGYGNAVGVPTITGRTSFHPSYRSNILVNAMAVGYFGPGQKIFSSKAAGVGNRVLYVGARTGRDGVHGASMASESFDENNESKKPNVQIGDPFFEKLLIEACLEIFEKNWVVAIQDMGAAGLTSSSFEMAAKGGVGLDLNLSLVPLRDSTMEPEEILLSESQERMLLVCEPRHVQEIEKVFSKWGLECVEVGSVTDSTHVKLWWKGELLTEIDPRVLVDQAPRYDRPFQRRPLPPSQSHALQSSVPSFSISQMARSLDLASYWPVYRQYDQRVGARTCLDASSDVAALRLPSGRNLFLSVGCRPELMEFCPRIGALDAVLFPCFQMALKGASALAVTDCLNFADPTRSEVMGEFVDSVEALVDVARSFNTPVISGNVSFYNETNSAEGRSAILPTPATGVVGLAPGDSPLPAETFQKAGNRIFLVPALQMEIEGGSSIFRTFLAAPSETALDLPRLQRSVEAWKSLSQHFVAARLVDRQGILGALLRMSTENLGFRNFSEKAPLDLLWNSFLLYAAIVEVEPEDEDLVQQKLGAQLLGVVDEGFVQFNSEKLLCSQLQRWRKSAWENHVRSF